MSTQTHIPTQMSFPLHLQKVTVTFQFVFHEFLGVMESVSNLDKVIGTLLSKGNEAKGREWNKFRDCVYQLTGSESEYLPGLPWMTFEGLLHRVYNYSHAFAMRRGKHHDGAVELNLVIEKALRYALQLREELPCVPGSRCVVEPVCAKRVLKLAEQFLKVVRRAGKLILKKLPDFHHDEDVVYFVLSRRRRIEGVFGAGVVASLFEKMYPNGVEQAEQFLIRHYTKRGFEEEIPKIVKEFDSL